MNKLLFLCLNLLFTQVAFAADVPNFQATFADKQLLDLILHDPVQALLEISKVRSQANNQLELAAQCLSPHKFYNKFFQIMQRYEKVNPIFFVGECDTGEDGFPCSFSRLEYPAFRYYFENSVISALVQKLEVIKDRSVQYTGFGVGGCFQELVIMVNTLKAKPDANLSFHLIELDFAPYVDYLDFVGKCRLIGQNTPTNFFEVGMTKKTLARCLLFERMFHQIIGFLKRVFPLANISLFLYKNGNDYARYIEQNEIMYADVISAIDIQDERSDFKNGLCEYYYLCAKVLRLNPTSKNFVLHKICSWNAAFASLAQIAITPTPNFVKMEGESIQFYVEMDPVTVFYNLVDAVTP